MLKQDYNRLQEANTKLKTKNSHYASVITRLSEQLNTLTEQIQQLYAGKPIQPKFYQQMVVDNLKRQLRDEKLSYQTLKEEVESLKAQIKQLQSGD